MRTQGTPRAPSLAGAPSGRALFLVLPVGFTLADVKWLVTDPAAELEAALERDGRRRRWLAAPAAEVERYRHELDEGEAPARRAGRQRAAVEAAERRARLRGDTRKG